MYLTDFRLTSTGPEAGESEWIAASVPGGVHESLLAAGRIEHPYFGRNAETLRWVEEATWWYRTEFATPDRSATDRVILTFPGLDTVASIWLNGRLLGEHASQFRPATFDVTNDLRSNNDLLVRFTPPLAGLEVPESVQQTADTMRAVMAAAMGSAAAQDESGEQPPGVLSANLALTLRRKGTFSWGWDFAPRLPAIGIWQPVELRVESGAALTGHHIRTTAIDLASRTATVEVNVEAYLFATTGPLDVRLTLTAPGGVPTSYLLPINENGSASATLQVTDAQLWWTHDLGTPARYDVHLELLARDGTMVDQRTDRIGLRTITIDRSPDATEGGRYFRFVLNGTPIYARGANWVPADMMIGSVTAQRRRALIEKAVAANMTMLRIWGGGIYEPDEFYDACDEAGLLVWHDFMFACIDYPSDDPALRAEVTAEAEYQVRRLRNHPCIAVWCGNNEVHAIHGVIDPSLAPGNWGYDFFHHILPTAVTTYSPGTGYWPGSPWASDDPHGVNGVLDGDRHAWEVWHGVDVGAGGPTEFATHGEAVHFHRYAYDKGKFISEFGIHAAPELSTLERWTEPGTLALHSAELDNRNKDVPKNKADDLMSVETGLPRDLREYLDFSMATQAEGLKFGIEHYRRRQPHNSGTLVWQLNDAWPGFSWSIVDYDLTPKAGYYFVQRAYQPVLASFRRTETDGLELWITNSHPEPVTLRLNVELATFGGKQLIDETLTVDVSALESKPVWTATAEQVSPGPDRFARVSDLDGRIEPNRLFFAPLKDLEFSQSTIDTTITSTGDGTATVELTAHGYHYLTRILTPAPGVRFSANYLDLRDGETRQITVTGLPAACDPADLVVASYPSNA